MDMTNEQYYDLIRPYEDARRLLETRLEILNHSLYGSRAVCGPIHNMQNRIKAKKSIEDKLRRLGQRDSVSNARDYLQDIAGIRVICYFVDDIYNLVKSLKRQTDLIAVREQDYIKNPKPNGYRSYHMIVEIPVFFSKGKTPMRAEIQIRTNGMDFWATLEHQLRYKQNIEEMDGYEDVSNELLNCARTVIDMDNEMQRIKNKIGQFHDI